MPAAVTISSARRPTAYVDKLVIMGVESRNSPKAGIEITCTYYQTRSYATSNVWVLDSHLHDNGGDGVMVGPVRKRDARRE